VSGGWGDTCTGRSTSVLAGLEVVAPTAKARRDRFGPVDADRQVVFESVAAGRIDRVIGQQWTVRAHIDRGFGY
jgi:hypothetical protein